MSFIEVLRGDLFSAVFPAFQEWDLWVKTFSVPFKNWVPYQLFKRLMKGSGVRGLDPWPFVYVWPD